MIYIFIFILLIFLTFFGFFFLSYQYIVIRETHYTGDIGYLLLLISIFGNLLFFFVPTYTIDYKIDDFLFIKHNDYVYFINDRDYLISDSIKYYNANKENIDLYIRRHYNYYNIEIASKKEMVVDLKENMNEKEER